MQRETQAGVVVGVCWAVGIGCALALIAGTGTLQPIPILLLMVLFVLGTCFALFSHQWHRSKSRPSALRFEVMVVGVLVLAAILGYMCWPKLPISVISILANANRGPGDTVRVAINLNNNTTHTLAVEEIGNSYFAPFPTNPSQRASIQNELWGRTQSNLDAYAVRREIPTLEHGEFNLKRFYGPLSLSQSDSVATGSGVVYFTQIIRDERSKVPLVEVCGYVDSLASFHLCYAHNLP